MLSRVQLFATPLTVARQAPLVHGILQARTLEWAAISFFRQFPLKSGPNSNVPNYPPIAGTKFMHGIWLLSL